MLLEGIFAPLTTPFHPDGSLFLSKLAQNVERYSRGPLTGLLVLDETAAESKGLTDAESEAVLETAIRAVASHKVMLASVGRDSVFATLRLARIAAQAGYDAIIVRVPQNLTQPELESAQRMFLQAVADSAPLEIVLDCGAENGLSDDLIAAVARHPRIIGLIDRKGHPARLEAIRAATSDISHEATVTSVFAAVTERMLRGSATSGSFVSAAALGGGTALAVESRPTLRTRTKRVGFQILTGQASTMLDSWQAGASGSLVAFGACAPQATCEVWQAFRDGDQPLAEEKQERLRVASTMVEGVTGIPALKYACDWNGYFGGHPRLPLVTPLEDAREQVEHALAGMRN